ncbi:hypothetical protein FRC19_004931 [Serendipita sp. 401]|nr:hypothetical protein FRC19_004931 [Serendipita sp. 401]
MSRPETQGPAELYYGDTEAQKYTNNSRIQKIQAEMTHRALELMSLPPDESLFLLDIGCGSGLSGEILDEMGHIWVGVDIAPSMLPLRNPSRAIFQFYPESDEQISLITTIARKAGFGGGIVVDYPNSKKARKVFLCLMVGSGRYSGSQDGIQNADQMEVDQSGLPKGLEGDDAMAEGKSIAFERRRARDTTSGHGKKSKRKVVDKTWILKKKELYRQRGKEDVPNDSRYTGRRRKPIF